MNPFIKFLTFYAVIFLILSFGWRFFPSLPIGHLPGDVVSALGNVTLYLAFGTTLVITGIVAFILYLFQRF